MSTYGKYSFLIAFANQLEAALTRDHGLNGVTDAVESIRASLEGLLASEHVAAGEGDCDDDDVVDAEDDDDGYGPPLGGPLPDQRERSASAVVVRTLRGAAGPSLAPAPGLVLGSERRDAPVLSKKGARRGKK